MDTIAARLKYYLSKKGISQGKFEKSANLSNGYIGNIKKAPGADKLTRIFDALPNLNRDWLLTGTGEMEKLGSHNENPGQNYIICGDQDFSYSTSSEDCFGFESREKGTKISILQSKLKEALEIIEEKNQHIEDLKKYNMILRNMISDLTKA